MIFGTQGARIMTIDQIEGNEPMHENFGTELGNEIDEGGDPPRVWDATLEKPGCAFSRSIGDNVAKKVGVCAEPELLNWDITPDDRFAVVASDGVFEFITSQNVVEMLARFEDPIEGAKFVVAEAYRLWLTYDDRTDDITIIIVYFDDIRESDGADVSGFSQKNKPKGPGTLMLHRLPINAVFVFSKYISLVLLNNNSSSNAKRLVYLPQYVVR
jgi:serine/threonine protein phosphatase PrpC